MSIETMKRALQEHRKNESHRTVAETRYWCEQYKLLAKQAIEQAQQCQCLECRVTLHTSDCAVHNEPAYPKGACDCGAIEQKQKQEPERWAAYMDGDERVTTYDSEIEACGERECEIDNDYEPGIEVEYLVAPMIDAKESLRRCNALRIGERIHEDIDCSLGDDMGAEDEVLSLDKDDLTSLGNLVIEFLCVRAKTKWWTVDHNREQKRTYIAGSNDEAAQGIKGDA